MGSKVYFIFLNSNSYKKNKILRQCYRADVEVEKNLKKFNVNRPVFNLKNIFRICYFFVLK